MRFIKLLTVTLAAGVVLAGVALLPDNLCFKNAEKYKFFCGNSSMQCREVEADTNPSLVKLTLSDVCGESAFYGTLDIPKFLASVQGEIVFTESLSDSVNFYCTANLPYKVTLYGKEINLHICVKDSGVFVASPIIFGGY